ncbi:18478_t:CDS:2 [Entrophospora sp. SA101]|nr:5854_t:CDS:2 [Entrophospora sp. SA101]CAJ0625729.1 5859_t:CDS:2 [Entrophospora sp. SA101]CAJ0753745.1 18478_t:CDS:2 [Entrophospora sp. SA101]CAJ0837849.1 7521_t:CDS:2 [Entrophospora sp. SA101]
MNNSDGDVDMPLDELRMTGSSTISEEDNIRIGSSNVTNILYDDDFSILQ